MPVLIPTYLYSAYRPSGRPLRDVKRPLGYAVDPEFGLFVDEIYLDLVTNPGTGSILGIQIVPCKVMVTCSLSIPEVHHDITSRGIKLGDENLIAVGLFEPEQFLEMRKTLKRISLIPAQIKTGIVPAESLPQRVLSRRPGIFLKIYAVSALVRLAWIRPFGGCRYLAVRPSVILA